MKKIFAFIFLAGSLAINVNAQIRRATDSTQNVVSNSGKRSERLETMSSLNLTKEQMKQLKELRRNMKQRRDTINDDQTLNDGLKQGKLKDLRQEQREKLNSILSPEQMEKLREQRMKNKKLRGSSNQSDTTGSILDN